MSTRIARTPTVRSERSANSNRSVRTLWTFVDAQLFAGIAMHIVQVPIESILPDHSRAGHKPLPDVHRPRRPRGHAGRVTLDGHYQRWGAHRRSRFRCHPLNPDIKSDVFAIPMCPRHPTDEHPHSGEACRECDRDWEQHDDPQAKAAGSSSCSPVSPLRVQP